MGAFMVRLFLFALFFCVFGNFSAQAQNKNLYEQFLGKWQAEQSESNIFEGTVHILYIKTRPGSRVLEMLLIYDDKQRGFLCSETEKSSELLFCEAVEVNRKDIGANNRADLVTQSFADSLFFVVRLNKHKEHLDVWGHHLTDVACLSNDGCSYQMLGTLIKK